MDGGRKRVNERELTKDNAFEDLDEGGGEVGGGTFLRADDAVLAGRRIVKARRPPASAAARGGVGGGAGVLPPIGQGSKPAAGLFAGFSLQNQPPRSPAPATVGDSDAGGAVEIPKEERDLDPRGRPVPPPPDPEEEEGPPKAAEADVHSDPETDDDEISSVPRKAVPQVSGEGKSEKSGEDKDKEREKEEAGQDGESSDPPETKQKDSGDGKKGGATPSGGFKVVATEGFAKFSTPFAGGAFSGSATSSPFSFGLSGSGTRASTPAVLPAPGAAASQGALPSLSSVFGSSNGTKVQLFGSAAEAGTSSAALATGSTSSAGAKTPAATLPPVDVVTGEEDEKALFAADASLFEFVEGGKWKERGKGEVRLNAPDKDSRPARLVMRARGNLRLLLNANLFSEMKVTRMDGKGFSFACINSVEDSSETSQSTAMSTLALRLKDEAFSAELIELMETHKHHKPAIGEDPEKESSKGEKGASEKAKETADGKKTSKSEVDNEGDGAKAEVAAEKTQS